MRKGDLGVVGLGWQSLQQDTALDHVDVLLAHQHGHARIDGQPSLVLELLDDFLEQIGVGFVAKLDVHPELVAGLIVELDFGLHRLDILGVHPVDINIDCIDLPHISTSTSPLAAIIGPQLCRVGASLTLLFELIKPSNWSHVRDRGFCCPNDSILSSKRVPLDGISRE